MQVAIAMLALEYERQKGKDMARAAKEKAFADHCDHEYQVPCSRLCPCCPHACCAPHASWS